jgi:hypothetical protein
MAVAWANATRAQGMIPWQCAASVAWPQCELWSIGYLGSRDSKHCSTLHLRFQLLPGAVQVARQLAGAREAQLVIMQVQ